MVKLGEFFRGKNMENNFKEMNEAAAENVELEDKVKDEKRVKGKIFKLSDEGYGFISSHEIPFTRIFFHWSSLKQNTKKFTELKVGDVVEFTPVEVKDKGTRAIRISVIEIGVS